MSSKRTVENELNFRNVVRERDGWRCQRCGSVEYPQAHHLQPGNNHPGNGVTLCVYCHALQHPEIPLPLFLSRVFKAEKDGYISAGALAKEFQVHPRTIVRRARKLGILKPLQEWMFTADEAEFLRGSFFTSPSHRGVLGIPESRHLYVTVDADQYEWLGRIVDERRSSFSQVVRGLIGELMKQSKKGRDENVSRRENRG